MSDKCKFCKEPLPIKALQFSNLLAIEKGYCSWSCLSMDLGHNKALMLLNDEELKRRKW